MSASVGCGAAGAGSWPGVLAQHPDDAAQLLECLTGGGAQQLRRSPAPAPAAGRGGPRARRRASASSEIRWASTSCISRAIRVRSAIRAWSSCRRWSASARSARSRSGQEQLASGPDEHAPRGGREGQRHDQQRPRRPGRWWGCRAAKTSTDGIHSAVTTQRRPGRAVHGQGGQREQPSGGRRARDRPEQQAQTSATPSGQRRRHHSDRQASDPQPTSTTTVAASTRVGLSCSCGLRNSAPSAAARTHTAASRAMSRLVRGPTACGRTGSTGARSDVGTSRSAENLRGPDMTRA